LYLLFFFAEILSFFELKKIIFFLPIFNEIQGQCQYV